MRPQFVFFNIRRTVWSEMLSTTSSRTKASASSFSVHRSRPSGGSLQARAISRALPSPSSLRSCEGRRCFLCSKAAGQPFEDKSPPNILDAARVRKMTCIRRKMVLV